MLKIIVPEDAVFDAVEDAIQAVEDAIQQEGPAGNLSNRNVSAEVAGRYPCRLTVRHRGARHTGPTGRVVGTSDRRITLRRREEKGAAPAIPPDLAGYLECRQMELDKQGA